MQIFQNDFGNLKRFWYFLNDCKKEQLFDTSNQKQTKKYMLFTVWEERIEKYFREVSKTILGLHEVEGTF